MPNKPMTICTYPGCNTLVLAGRCERHPYPRQPDMRPNSSQRGYGAAWQQIRRAFLMANPYCQENRKCRPPTKATEVDHDTPRRQGGTDDWDNLRAMCKPCHSSKTAREDTPRRGGRFHATTI